MKLPVTVLIMTHNEEANIGYALDSVTPYFNQIVVVDSFSSDRTVAICEGYPDVYVYMHLFTHWAEQRNWMLENCALNNELVFFLDADEYVDKRLIHELALLLDSATCFGACILEREFIFLGGSLKYAHGHPGIERIFRREGLHFKGEGAREYAFYKGSAIKLKSPYIHHDRKSVADWIEKHNRNSDLEALLNSQPPDGNTVSEIDYSSVRNYDRQQNLRIRRKAWNRIPRSIRPFVYFFFRYIVRLGILDGRSGLIYNYLHAFWYQSLISIKTIEAQRQAHILRLKTDKGEFADAIDIADKMKVTVLIMTENEESNIEHCIVSVKDSFDQVIVTDSFSVDSTLQICRSYPEVELFQNKFAGWAEQRNWMLDHCDIRNEIVFFLDADETIQPNFIDELRAILTSGSPFQAILLNVRYLFLQKYLKFSYGHPPIARIFRKEGLHFLGEGAREYARFSGKVMRMKAPITHHDRRPLSFWIRKHNKNSDREARVIIDRSWLGDEQKMLSSISLRLKLFTRTKIWNRFPAIIKPFCYFMYRFILKLGFLDGRAGLIYCYLHAFWYYSLIDIKVYEHKQSVAKPL